MQKLRSFHRSVLTLAGVVALTMLSVSALSVASEAATKVTIRLDWKAGAQHSPFYLGKVKGYYTQQGIDLTIIPGSGSSDSVKQVGTGAVDLALVDALVMAQALEQEVPVTSVAAYYQRSPISIMSPKKKPVTDPKQLMEGVKLGSKKGSATYQGLIAFLSANNIKQEQITLVDVGFGVQPLLVGQVDALMAFTMNEPIQAERAGMPIQEIMIADHGVNTYGLTLAVNNEFMAEHGDIVTGFLRATKAAMVEAAKNPNAAVEAVAASIDGVDKGLELAVLAKVVPFWTSKEIEGNGYGWQTEARWQQTLTTAKTLGLIESVPEAMGMFTNTHLNK